VILSRRRITAIWLRPAALGPSASKFVDFHGMSISSSKTGTASVTSVETWGPSGSAAVIAAERISAGWLFEAATQRLDGLPRALEISSIR
jgi:hypothetical protein